jgi:hypothetical protein
MNSLFSISIPKRQAVCAHQSEKFTPGMDVFSLLTEDESEKIIRHDFCATCWTHIQPEINLQKNRGYWKSTIEKKTKLSDASRAEQALALLRLLLENPVPHEAEIFVLCLFLAHARQLVLRKESVKEGTTYYHYELLKRGEWMTVKMVQLSSVEIETIQRSIADKLQTLMN